MLTFESEVTGTWIHHPNCSYMNEYRSSLTKVIQMVRTENVYSLYT